MNASNRIALILLCFLMLRSMAPASPTASIELNENAIARNLNQVPAPVILVKEQGTSVEHSPIIFSHDQPMVEFFQHFSSDCLVQLDGACVIADKPSSLSVLDSIVLPETFEAVHESLLKFAQRRFDSYNNQTTTASLNIGMMETNTRWVAQDVITLGGMEETLSSFLVKVMMERPLYNFIVYIAPSEGNDGKTPTYEVTVSFAYLGRIPETPEGLERELRYYYLTGDKNYKSFVESPAALAHALSSSEEELVEQGRTFLRVKHVAGIELGEALRRTDDPYAWADIYMNRLLVVAGLPGPGTDDDRLYEVISKDPSLSQSARAARGAEYFAAVRSDFALPQIHSVLAKYPTLSNEEVDHVIRAMILLPESDLPPHPKDIKKVLFAILSESELSDKQQVVTDLLRPQP